MDFPKCVTFLGALLLLGACLPADACDCMPNVHPQSYYCDSNTVIILKFLKETKMGNQNGYVIEIIKVLKGNEALKNSKFIGTPDTSASCKYDHPKGDGADYVAIVHNENGKITIGSCNYKMRWSKLTRAQKSGFEKDYKAGCITCKIIPDGACDPPPCKPKKNQCILTDKNQDQYQGENLACLPSKYGACAWTAI